jgi:O-antigen/teichoic acid export membrane protein
MLRRNDLINIFSLGGIQGGNALIPIFLLPYFLTTIGTKGFAAIATTEAIAYLILTFSLYSFDISGIKKILDAKNVGLRQESNVYHIILYSRLIIFFSTSIVFGVLIYIYQIDLVSHYLIWLCFPLGMVLQSAYYFQTVGASSILATLVVVPRIASCSIGVLLVKNDSNAELASATIAFSYLTTGLLSFLYIRARVGFVGPKKIQSEIIATLIEGKDLFLAGCSVMLYRGGNTLLISFIANSPEAVSVYVLAEKYVRMLQSLSLPLTQFFMVRAVTDLKTSKNKIDLFRILWKNTKLQVAVCMLITLLFFLVRDSITAMMGSLLANQVASLLSIMIGAVAFGVINYMFGSVALNALGRDREYAKIVLFVGSSSIFAATILIKNFSAPGAAVAYIFAEVFLSLLVFIALMRKGESWSK